MDSKEKKGRSERVFWAIYRCVRGIETGRHLSVSKRAVTAAVSSSQREKRG
jgi:hypothetical protein